MSVKDIAEAMPPFSPIGLSGAAVNCSGGGHRVMDAVMNGGGSGTSAMHCSDSGQRCREECMEAATGTHSSKKRFLMAMAH